jgi:peptidoglycan/xylan/chitin deacetylase (PgdA/CDA1 family)
MARAYPQRVKQIVADGHRICDHSMTHDEYLPFRGDARIRSEIIGTRDLLNQLVPGTPIYYFRPPGGDINNHEIDLVESWGMKALYWSVDTRDWTRKGVNSIMIQVRTELDPGGVILMHDGGGDRSQTVQALKILIPQLIAQGYQFDFPRH